MFTKEADAHVVERVRRIVARSEKFMLEENPYLAMMVLELSDILDEAECIDTAIMEEIARESEALEEIE